MSALTDQRRARTSKVFLSPTKPAVLQVGESDMQRLGIKTDALSHHEH